MIISYKKQFPWGKPTNFKQKILDGTKIHTMREDKLGRWKAGRHIHHAHGVRTKNYDCFLENDCVSDQKVRIERSKGNKDFVTISINEEPFYLRQGGIVVFDNGMIELAKNDGFDSVDDFFKWFDSDFSGKIIHWTDFKYKI